MHMGGGSKGADPPCGAWGIPPENILYGVGWGLFRTSPKQNSNPNYLPYTLKKERAFYIMRGHQGEHKSAQGVGAKSPSAPSALYAVTHPNQ